MSQTGEPLGRTTDIASTLPVPFDVESIRFKGEQVFASTLHRLPGLQSLCPRPDTDPQRIRRHLLARSMQLSEGMAPELHAAARRCAERFGIREPVEIFQAAGAENAAMHMCVSPVLLEIQGRLLSLLDGGALDAVIGHELGHYLAHGADNPDSALLTQLGGVLHGQGGSDEVLAVALRYSMARELTADRFGLLACDGLDTALRLEMVIVTGLSAQSLSWDTQAYLEQSKALMEDVLADDGDTPASTHPEHSLRTYALWLFSETDVYHRLTGQGPGTRRLAEVDDILMRILGLPDIELGVAETLDTIPPEVHECALAACVLVANADGELHDSELEAIERIFAPLVADWEALTGEEAALERFQTLAPLIHRAGPKTQRALFALLTHVLAADGEAHPAEIDTILALGAALGCRSLYRELLTPLLDHFRIDVSVVVEADRSIPMPARHDEADAALRVWFSETVRHGGGEVSLRRLLRLLGSDRHSAEAVQRIEAEAQRAGLLIEPPFGEDLDGLHSLRLRPDLAAARETAPSPPPPGLGDSAERLRNGLARLRDRLISGDGRSPSVRLRRCRSGRSLDLYGFERVSTGLAERSLALIQAGRRTRLLDAAEVGGHESAEKLARELIHLDREHRARLDESGAHDLCLGYPFLTGLVGGYLVRAPLVLYPVRLERGDLERPAFALHPLGEAEPVVNQSLLRLMFARKAQRYPDELAERLDALAAESVPQVLAELERAGLPGIAVHEQLHAFTDRDEEFELWRDDRLEIEECAVLGLFPQSSSDLLQDYDDLLATIERGEDPSGLLGAALELLPGDLKTHYAPSPKAQTDEDHVDEKEIEVAPVIYADPSQQAVLERVRETRALVVDGPPGTGKSQVIVNLVAEALRRGERVAVVCEKRAALDVVANRLGGVGMRHLLAVVHDIHEDRKPLFQQIQSRLAEDAPRPDPRTAWTDLHVELEPLAAALQEKNAALAMRHRGLSFGECHSFAGGLDVPSPDSDPLAELDLDALEALAVRFAELQAYADLWAPDASWAAPTGSPPRQGIADWDGPRREAFTQALRAAAKAASDYENGLAKQQLSDAQGEALEAAATALEVAEDSLASCRSNADYDFLARSLGGVLSGDIVDLDRQLRELQVAWDAAGDAPNRFGGPVTLTLDAGESAAVNTLVRDGGSFLRFFKPGWWKAKRSVQALVVAQWPEQAATPLTPALGQAILARQRAARAWQTLRSGTTLLGAAAPPEAAAVPAWLAAMQSLGKNAEALAQLRPALDAIQAWPEVLLAAGLRDWRERLGLRRQLLALRRTLREAGSPLRVLLPWIGSAPSSAGLDALESAWRRDAVRLVEADRIIGATAELATAAPVLLPALAAAQAEGRLDPEPGAWADAVRKAWAEAGIAILEGRHAGVERLDREGGRTDREQGERLAQLVARRADLAAECLLAGQDRRPFLRVPPPAPRARRTPAQQAREAMTHETGKRRRLLPLRSFVRRFLDEGLLDVLPVWLLSPETMAILFPRRPVFDLVILDEGSQCTVESGLPVLMRAGRTVIAGDEKQMPPSNFFKSGDRDEDETPDAAREMFDAESLLVLARARAEHIGLQWHYRCLHEELIAFSNHALYDGGLNTIPSTASPLAAAAIRWEHVEDAEYADGVNTTEAGRVVDLIHGLLTRDPAPSVGVVTFNLSQRRAVQDAIDARRTTDPAFAACYDAAVSQEALDQRPFVKNLESVQGDERDVILFSLGHAPRLRERRDGSTEQYVPARFGPLGQRGGERRLNVAISRAKREIIVVASFDPALLSVARSKHIGPRLLKAFLEFAQHRASGRGNQAERVLAVARGAGGSRRQTIRALPEACVPLKTQIALALERQGVATETDVGTSEFRIALAVIDPARRDHYRLGILCEEGEREHPVMESHVHIPNVLELRGWRFVRVTSREWLRDRDDVLRRIEQALAA